MKGEAEPLQRMARRFNEKGSAVVDVVIAAAMIVFVILPVF